MGVFRKEIQLSTTFSKIENQIPTFSRQKMRFKLLLKRITFFEHFWKFSQDVSVSYPIYFSKKNFSSEAKGRDQPIRQAWTNLSLIPVWNFERWVKIMLILCYLLHPFHILAITFRSKFQLIQDGCFLKGNSIIYNFVRNRENQISMFFRPKIRFNLLLKIMTFLSIFWIFPISKYFQKSR